MSSPVVSPAKKKRMANCSVQDRGPTPRGLDSHSSKNETKSFILSAAVPKSSLHGSSIEICTEEPCATTSGKQSSTRRGTGTTTSTEGKRSQLSETPFSCMAVWFLLIAIAGGFARVIQLSAAADVGRTVNSKLMGALLVNSMTMTLFWVSGIVSLAFWPPGLSELAGEVKKTARESPWTMLTFFSGICGAIALWSGVLVGSILGFGLYFVLVTCAQIGTSVGVEACGICWMEKRAVTGVRIAGLLVLLGGTILFVLESLLADSLTVSVSQTWLIIFPLMTGVANVVISTGNRRLGQMIGSKFRAAAISTTLSTGLTGITVAVASDNVDMAQLKEDGKVWYILLGVCGFIILSVAIIMPGYIGLAVTICCMIFGQLLCSLIADSTGLLGVEVFPATALRIVGVAIVLAGVLMVRFDKEVLSGWKRFWKKMLCS